jgi:hypothetical protein
MPPLPGLPPDCPRPPDPPVEEATTPVPPVADTSPPVPLEVLREPSPLEEQPTTSAEIAKMLGHDGCFIRSILRFRSPIHKTVYAGFRMAHSIAF